MFNQLQEVFDAAVSIPAGALALLYEIDETQKKHMDDIKKFGITKKLQDEYKLIADRYGLSYTQPYYYEEGLAGRHKKGGGQATTTLH